MLLLDHVSITVKDLDRCKSFYNAIMKALGAEKIYDEEDAIGFGARCSAADETHTYLTVFSSSSANGDPRRHWCFKALSRETVRAFHAAGLAHGGEDDGAPGLRPHYHENYFGAFLLDPEGNRVEAVCHRAE
ncbi:MAG: VOC family protein [Ectothiorhodospiraceae bacterium]|nr:VOC family protein [Ectothiorhodospiraceae bacterium]MCH8506045.1 VOC family protein [Ectothiorhodospiraceae bacterium]